MDDPTIENNGGTTQEGKVRPNLEDDMRAAGIDVDAYEDTEEDTPEVEESDDTVEETHEESDDDQEDLVEQKRTAISEAIKNSKKAKRERAEKEFYKTAHEVLKDPNRIVDINDQDPELADKIAKENWGVSYRRLLEMSNETDDKKTAPSVDPTMYTEEMLEKIVEEKLAAKQTASVKEQIEKYAVDFFVENDVDLKGPTFKAIMQEFEEESPKTMKRAQRLLRILYEEHTGRSSVHVPSLDGVSMPSSRTRSAKKSTAKKAQRSDIAKLAQSIGMDLTAEDIKKYGGKFGL